MILLGTVERVVRDTIDPRRYRAFDISVCVRGRWKVIPVAWDRMEGRLSRDRGFRRLKRLGGLRQATEAVKDEVVKELF